MTLPASHQLSQRAHLGSLRKERIGVNVNEKEKELDMIPARITTGSQVLKNIYGEEGLGTKCLLCAPVGERQLFLSNFPFD